MTSPVAVPAPETPAPFLSLAGIRKVYPGVIALSGLDMDVRPGEVIGLVGENGAGKSTLMKILGGVIEPTEGTITVDGSERPALTVADSLAAGIAFVHQELNLFDNLDVAANIYIGREPLRGGPLRLVDTDRLHRMVKPLLDRVGANFGPATPVKDLSLAQQQMVEIAKALSLNARLVILDEPTSSLPPAETEKLLDIIAGLKAQGIAVIFISHRLTEVERAADRVVVLRDGQLIGTLDAHEIKHESMVRMMIGRDLKVQFVPPRAPAGAVALSARGLRTGSHPGKTIDLELRHGEILGLAGLVGSGRTELARAIFGIDPILEGDLLLEGEPYRPRLANDAVKRGIFLAPEDRKASGLLLDFPIAQNISLPNMAAHARAFMVTGAKEARTAEAQRQNLGIKATSVTVRTGALSGGNQQKVVLGKWLAMNPSVMMLDEPTRGIDVGAKAEIYRLMRELADSGVALLMISSDMEEVIGVSDRVAVMHEGGISGLLDRHQVTEENVLRLAVGQALKLPAAVA
jgi:ribose transport system ATP-binding protein